METSDVMGNADTTVIPSNRSVFRQISSDETIKLLIKNDYELDELETLERTTEYLDENYEDKFDIVEPSTSKMQSLNTDKNLCVLNANSDQLPMCKSDIFICGLCPKRFTFPNPIQWHMFQTHPTKRPIFKCSCDLTILYDSIDELVQHKAQYACLDKQLKCSLCELYFTTRKELEQHKTMKGYFCSKCRTTYDKCTVLVEHLRHQSTVGPFTCEACGFKTSSCMVLKNHTSHCTIHTTDQKSPSPKATIVVQGPRPNTIRTLHVCDVCQKVYRKRSQLLRHQEFHHSLMTVYMCEYCKVTFDVETAWRCHKCSEMKANEGGGREKTERQTMYQCNFCKDTFIKPFHLKNHMRSSHYVNIANQVDMLSCLKKVNVMTVKQVRKPESRNVQNAAAKTSTSLIPKSENIEMSAENNSSKNDVTVKLKSNPQDQDEELELETKNATDSLVFLENPMEIPIETMKCEVKTEDFQFDLDNEDFEDDIIILDTDNSIHYKKEEPCTPEHSAPEVLQSIDDYLATNERLHTFSLLVERVAPVVKQEEADLQPQNGHSTIAIDQLLKMRSIFQKQAEKRPLFQCTNVGCNKVFAMKRDIKEHLMKMECKHLSEIPHFQCLRCGMRTDDIRLYIKHWENHGFETDQCPSCLVNTCGNLFSHIQEHISNGFLDGPKTYTCSECGIPVTLHYKLQHWESHLLYNERCKSKTSRIKPTYALPKVCSVCSKPLQRSSDLKRHLIEHIIRDALRKKGHDENFKCDLCKSGVSFETVIAFKQHWREHADLRVYKCKICGKTFADSSNFTKHKKVHNLKCMQCDTCGRKFASKRMLIEHMKYHETNKPLKCTACDKIFHFRSLLTKHFKNVHSYKKYSPKCSYCLKQFTGARELRCHLWNEHGVRNSKADCQFCGWKCRTEMQLRAHYSVKHNIIIKKRLKKSSKKKSRK